MNFWDILILILAGCAAGRAISVMRKKKNNGGCSCGCGGCTKECAARKDENSGENAETRT